MTPLKLELSEADFDAYAPERTRATTMTAPRGALKRKLEAWMREIRTRLEEESFEVSASDEHPSARNGHRVEMQSAYLFRAKDARAAMEHALGARAPADDADHPEAGHARVEVRVDASSASLFLWLGGDAQIDLEHAHAILAHPTEDVLVAWEGLPETTVVDARASLSSRGRHAIDLMPRDASAMAKQAIESEVPLVIGVRVARAEATEPHALDAWSDAAVALGKLLAVVQWSPQSAEYVAARTSERPSRRGKRHAPPKSAPVLEERPQPAMKATIDRGSHVRALAGPFAGQAGVVQELDGKGGARVLFGLLAARVELRDLVVKGKERGRPLLASSHRKPTSG